MWFNTFWIYPILYLVYLSQPTSLISLIKLKSLAFLLNGAI